MSNHVSVMNPLIQWILYGMSALFADAVIVQIKGEPWQPVMHTLSCFILGPMLTGSIGYLLLFFFSLREQMIYTIIIFEFFAVVVKIYRKGITKFSYKLIEASPYFHLSLFITGCLSLYYLCNTHNNFPSTVQKAYSRQLQEDISLAHSFLTGFNQKDKSYGYKKYLFVNPINNGEPYLKPSIPNIFLAMCQFDSNLMFIVKFINSLATCAFSYFVSTRYLNHPTFWVPVLTTLSSLPLIINSMNACFSIPLGLVAIGFITLKEFGDNLFNVGGVFSIFIPSPAISLIVAAIASRRCKRSEHMLFLPYWIHLIVKCITRYTFVPAWRSLQNEGILCAEIYYFVKKFGPLLIGLLAIHKFSGAEFILSSLPFYLIRVSDPIEVDIVNAAIITTVLSMLVAAVFQLALIDYHGQARGIVWFLYLATVISCAYFLWPSGELMAGLDSNDIDIAQKIIMHVPDNQSVIFPSSNEINGLNPLIITGKICRKSDTPLISQIPFLRPITHFLRYIWNPPQPPSYTLYLGNATKASTILDQNMKWALGK